MRIFTNDVATVNALRRADERAQATAWGDFPATGRLNAEADLDAFARSRAAVFRDLGWDEDDLAEADFLLRNAGLRDALESGDELSLLFGGSLRDQLQLAQILYWLSFRSGQALKQARLMVVDGPLSIFDDGALLEVAKEGEALDFNTLDAYRSFWTAATSTDAMNLEFAFRRLAHDGNSSLSAALERWLQELPAVENGLSISEAQALDAVRLGIGSPQELYEAVQETEASPFRVNWEFWHLLDSLCSGDDPLLRTRSGAAFLCPPRVLAWEAFHAQRLEVTERGLAVLNGEQHYVKGAFPARWLGGALIDGNSRWFWDYGRKSITTESSGLAEASR